MLALRRTVADYHAEGALWAEFGELLKSPDGPPMSGFGKTFGTTYFDDDYKESDVDMAVWGEYLADQAPSAPLVLLDFPEQRVAYATLYGPYEGTGAISEAIGSWVAEHGLTLAGPMFNIFVVGPGQDPNPEHWVTEVNYPIS